MSIYTWIRDNSPASDAPLPDHADLGEDRGQWVPGAYEALLMRSDASIRRPALYNLSLALKARKQMKQPGQEHAAAFEKAVLGSGGAIGIVDPLISFLYKLHIDRNAARTEALRLCLEGEKRELVKTGIALLGVYGDPADDLAVLKVLAAHEEFTFFCAPAIRTLAGDEEVNDVLLPLARALGGWGKTAVLYELNYEKPEAREFCLREGCRNRLGNAENANVCATKGRLSERLNKLLEGSDPPDDALFAGICDIFEGLTTFDGQHDSLNDYKFGNAARSAFAELLKKFPRLKAAEPRAEKLLERMR